MLRRILIPLDPSPYATAALEYGCYLVKRYNAEITGLVILDIPGIEKSIGPVPAGAFYYAQKLEKLKEEQAREHIHTLLDKFKRKCEQEGVMHREAECQGHPSERILHESIFYDLVIMGFRTYFHFETNDAPGDSLEKILDHSIVPILMVPSSFRFDERARVLVAFNGSLPAAGALQDFVHVFQPSSFEITLLTSDEDQSVANYYLDRAQSYLNAHSFSNVEKVWTTQDIIRVMEERFLDWADLVVIGAHSKKGLLDFMVGSLGQYLIKEAKKPVFLGQ